MQEIICILDKSGSMMSCAGAAVEGFNQFLEEQNKVGEANLTLVWFDNGYQIGYEGKLTEAKPIDYWPNGGLTALHDAIGKTFNHVKERFSKEKPEKVVMAILTDGHENASKEFNSKSVGDLIEEHEDKYGWDVIYLGANQDAKAVAMDLKIKADKAFNYGSNNTREGMAVYSSTVTNFRS